MSVTDLDHLPSFRGDDYKSGQLDALLAFAFNQRDLEDSRSLFSSKWWDYRYLHLGHSVFLFAHYYGQTVERWRGKFGISPHIKLDHLYHPIWREKRKRGGKLERTLAPDATRTGWLRAVLFADSYGIPYDKWINWAFEYAFECQWKRIPGPTMLYGDRLAMAVHQKWEDECASLLALPTDPKYLAEAYCGHVWQDEFQDWLMDRISKRTNPATSLRNFLINEPFICEDRARLRLGNAVVDQAFRH